nr:GNAT family N-acetyltransferase [Micromonospora purpureochromogenes]
MKSVSNGAVSSEPLPAAVRGDPLLRRAKASDVNEIVAVHLSARAAAPMPAAVHSDDEVHNWLSGVTAVDEAWVAESGGRVAAYARFSSGWLEDLYVAPAQQRAGLGSALLDLVKTLQPNGFGLWVFESNLPARAFYIRHGLVEVERTDGSRNEERAPDIRMMWHPSRSHSVAP